MSLSRPTQGVNYDRYRASLSTLFRHLSNAKKAFTDLAALFSLPGYDGTRQFIELGNQLGQNASVSELLCKEDARERVYLLLERWSQQDGTTIGVLRTVLQQLRRDDAVARLDELRLNFVLMIISIKRDGEVIHELSQTIPGAMEIVEFVRPLMYRLYGLKIATNHQLMIRIDRKEGFNWSSPASQHAGRQLTLYIDKVIYPIQVSALI